MTEKFEFTQSQTEETIKEKQQEKIIMVKDIEGKEREFNLDKIKDYWVNFFQKNNLPEITEVLKEVEIKLASEQIEDIKKRALEGFDYMMLLPPIELQQKYLKKIIRETTKKLETVDNDQQYSEKGILLDTQLESDWLPGNVAARKLITLHRPINTPYLVFTKDTREVDKGTLGKSASQLRNPNAQEYLEGENLNLATLLNISDKEENSGLTLAEYLAFQRDFVSRHGVHPDTNNGAILLSTEKRYDTILPMAIFNENDHRIHLFAQSTGEESKVIGTRFTKIYEIT